jgi:hypothetical protein
MYLFKRERTKNWRPSETIFISIYRFSFLFFEVLQNEIQAGGKGASSSVSSRPGANADGPVTAQPSKCTPHTNRIEREKKKRKN